MLLRINEEIYQFEKSYSKLLDKSKELIKKKDFTAVTNIINLSSLDPQKWTDADRKKFQEHELENILKYVINSENLIKLNRKIKDYLSDEKKRKISNIQNLLNLMNSGKKIPEEEKSNLWNLYNDCNKFTPEISILKDHFKNLDSEEWSRGFEFYVMFVTSMELFFLLSDILLHRLTFIWSKNIQDKHLLQQLNVLVFDSISKINLIFSDFINSVRVLLPENDYIKLVIDSKFENRSLSLRMSRYFYKGLKMEDYLVEVIDSMMSLDRELSGYRSVQLYSPPKIINETVNYNYFVENLNMPHIDEYKYYVEHMDYDFNGRPLDPIYNDSDIGNYEYYLIENFNLLAIVKDLEKKENYYKTAVSNISKIIFQKSFNKSKKL